MVEPTEPWWFNVKVVLNVYTVGWSMNSFKVCCTISVMPRSGKELIIITYIMCVSIRMYMHWPLKSSFSWCCFLAVTIKHLFLYSLKLKRKNYIANSLLVLNVKHNLLTLSAVWYLVLCMLFIMKAKILSKLTAPCVQLNFQDN